MSSISRDLSDDGGDSDAGPGKPGRKKNPNSAAARRDQNRIAQREFRLRKQQRIRDLEARVEILSGGKDEALGEMRNMLKDLMQENMTLRNLLRSLSGFIGDGVGGVLPKLGWELSDFNDFLDKGETDTAWEGYQRRKKTDGTTTGQKRSMDDDPNGARKKSRGEQDFMMLGMQQPMYGNARPDTNGLFGNANGAGMFPATNTPPQYGGPSPPAVNGYSAGYNMPPVNMLDSSIAPLSFPGPSNGQASASSAGPSRAAALNADEAEDDDDPNKSEAYKLIHYHLDNFKRNSAYCLPSSLRPTVVQRTVPHEGVIDRILHPDLRDKMILLRGRFDLVDCLLEYRSAVTIHGDDVLAHQNWEISEKWLRAYGFLVEAPTLAIMNRWRRERGEPELRLHDINAEAAPAP